MNTHQDCLNTLKEAIELSRAIYDALLDGDSKLANTITLERQKKLDTIPFQQLNTSLSTQNSDTSIELRASLEELISLNQQLTETSEQVKEALSNELGKVKKGINGTQAYQTIKHSL